MKRVLITGATGFVGSNALTPLLERGYEVHAVARRPPAEPVHEPARGAVTWHAVDLLDGEAAAAATAAIAPSHLLHFAWYAVHRLFWTSPLNVQWVEASLRLLRAFEAVGGRRAVLAGTCAEYDPAAGWCSEATTTLAPSLPYGIAKDALRRLLGAQGNSGKLSWAWGRIFHLHGPGEHAARLVPDVTRAMLRGEPTRCSHGRQIRDYQHVDDVAAGFVALLDAEGVEGAVNVASGAPRELREVVRAVADAVGKPELVRFGDVPAAGDAPLLIADVRRLREEVGFTPRWSFEAGIEDTVRWWRARGEEAW